MIITSVWASAGVGGTERRMADAFASMVESGHEVNAVFLPHRTRRPQRLVELLRSSGCQTAAGMTSSLRLLRRSDLVIAMGLRASLLCRAGALSGVISNLTDVRNGLEMGRPAYLWRADRATQTLVDRYVCNSRSAADVLVRNGISARRVRVLRSALSSRWTEVSHGPGDPRALMMVGNDRPEKNQAFGVRVTDALRRRTGHDYLLTIFTDDASALRRQAAVLDDDSGEWLTFVEGRVVRPSDYAGASVLLHPSLSESAPLVVLEAQSQGLRVVASDVGDTADLVGDRGETVATFQEGAWIDAISRQLDLRGSAGQVGVDGAGTYAAAFLALSEKS